MLIEQHCPRLTALGNRIGSHFMLIFCLHLTELNCFPWSSLLTCFNEHRITNTYVQAVLFFVIHILLITGGLLICLLLRRLHPAGHGKNTLTTESGAAPVSKRVEWVDMAKGTCILLMLYAHMPIDSNIRQIIFSFHMPAFMLLSGYLPKTVPGSTFLKAHGKGFFCLTLALKYWLHLSVYGANGFMSESAWIQPFHCYACRQRLHCLA